MNFKLIKAGEKYRNVIKNLMQFYIYDFSAYFDCEVEEDGLYKEYPYLDDYWKDENHRFPYLIEKDEVHIGFALIKFIESEVCSRFSIAEFFVMKKYRRKGVGRAVAKQIFDLHKGSWEVYQIENNKPAQIFWNNVIDEYTKGAFKERFENGRRIQNFES